MTRPYRPLFVLPDLQGGGAERVVLSVLRHLDPARFAPELFLIKDAGVYWDELPASLPHSAAIGANRRLIANLPTVLARLTRAASRSDVVVGALELDATYLAHAAARLTRRPAVGWVHVSLPPYLAKMRRARRHLHARLVPRVYPRLARVVVPVAGVANALRRVATLPESRIDVISNPLDVGRVRRLGDEAVPASLAPVLAKPTIVAVGRLAYQKGFDVLLRAHARLRAAGVDHELVILGEGELRGELEALAASLGVRASTHLPGFIPNPFPVVRAARALALSSRFEGFGMVVAEALALGTPCIATDCDAGPADVLAHGRYGSVVPTGDDSALAEALGCALTEPERARAVARLGLGRAEEFQAEAVVPKWEALLAELAELAPRAA